LVTHWLPAGAAGAAACAVAGATSAVPARHGYDLKRAYDQRFETGRELSFGTLYRALAHLVRDGQVSVVAIEPGAGPERKRYAITEAGVNALQRWLAEPEDPHPHLQELLFLKVMLALISGRPAKAYLQAQQQHHLARMRELTTARGQATATAALRLDYELFHIEADLRWLGHAQTRLAGIAAEVR
jgi:DNA-binding PadR family transcriptional regulator